MTAYNVFSGLVRLLSTFVLMCLVLINNALLFGLVGKQTLLQVGFGDASPHTHALSLGHGTGSSAAYFIHTIYLFM